MKICNLSFGKIVVLSKNLAEVIVDEGVLMDEIKVAEYHAFLLNSLESPFSLLINKKHSYCYTFSAQKNIAKLKQIKALAVVAHTSGGVMSTETLINVNGNYKLNIRVFYKREEAVTWLSNLE